MTASSAPYGSADWRPPQPPAGRGMTAGKVIALIAGIILAVAGLASLAGGAAAIWAHTTQRDSAGYYTSPTERFSAGSYAITSDKIDLGADEGPGDVDPIRHLGTARIRAERLDRGPVFVGIGSQSDVQRYLASSAHDRIAHIDTDPFRVQYQLEPGEQQPAPPASQPFWAVAASGGGRQSVSWDLRNGSWAVVVMNADATRGVRVRADAGLKTGWLLPIGIGLLILGLILLAVAVLLIVVGLRRRGRAPVPPPAGAPSVAGAQPGTWSPPGQA